MTDREKAIVYDSLLEQARKTGFETLAQAVAKACRQDRDIDTQIWGDR